jgi:hypothetical protein
MTTLAARFKHLLLSIDDFSYLTQARIVFNLTAWYKMLIRRGQIDDEIILSGLEDLYRIMLDPETTEEILTTSNVWNSFEHSEHSKSFKMIINAEFDIKSVDPVWWEHYLTA